VASDLDAFRRVLQGGRAGELFTTGDPAELGRAARRLLDSPERRARLSAAATTAVSAYDWSMVARDVVSVYETVVLGTATVALAR
jgi:phosphatidyl-myo-inositol alpha-mannosyltransferase